MKIKYSLTHLLTFFFIMFFTVQLSAQNATNPRPDKNSSEQEWQQWRERENSLRKQFIGNHDWRFEGVHDGNQVSTVFYNYGTIGQPRNAASLVWPKGSGYDYGFEFGVIIGAEVIDTTGFVEHIISEGLDIGKRGPDGLPWGFEPLEGYARFDNRAIAMNNDTASWPKTWPNRPSNWDGHWIAEYGIDENTADQESYFIMDDAANIQYAFFPTPDEPERRGIGVEIESRGYQWHQTLAQDCIFYIYNVKNVGVDTVKKVYLGMFGDPHVGGADDYNDDDGSWDTFYDMVYAWDHDFRGRPNSWLPGYLGYKYLESPGEPYDQRDNDEDGLIDESMQDDIDNDNDWDQRTDDVGADGVSGDLNRNGLQDGNEIWDEGEGDGYPTHGEPNFDEKDLDEADQIGLTSFDVIAASSFDPGIDAAVWKLIVAGTFATEFAQTTDNVFLYASGSIKMASMDERRFSITVFFGYDEKDLFRSAKTVQRIYNEGYRFTKAPEKPQLKAVAGDGRVTLYWDDFAESSRDPIHGYDFAGYNIYRGTDHGMSDAFTITDAQGNPTLYKPIAQFSLPNDGWWGPHPLETENGIHFFMGEDDETELQHSWTDTTVMNGQVYYYAVVSYDHGDSTEIPPTECSWQFEEYPIHSAQYYPTVNTAIVTPQAVAAGYEPPYMENNGIDHDGPATGDVDIEFIDPEEVLGGHTYKITFDDTSSTDTTFYMWDDNIIVSQILPVSMRFQYTDWDTTVYPAIPIDSVEVNSINLAHSYILDNEEFHLFNADSSYEFPRDTSMYELNAVAGKIIIKDTNELPIDKNYYVKYQYYAIANSPHLDGSDNNPYIDGLKIRIKNEPLNIVQSESRFIEGNSNYKGDVKRYFNQGVPLPYDYAIIITDTISSYSFDGNKPCRFIVYNVTDSAEAEFVFQDSDKDSSISDGDLISPITYVNNRVRGTWQVKFYAPRDSIVTIDSLNADGYPVKNKENEVVKIPIDTIFVEKIPPMPGDVFLMHTSKPFSSRDIFSFKTQRSRINKASARDELSNVAVVPNPYVAVSEYELKPNLISGRGDRLLYFIHLPAECTIRIYTLSGDLVQTLHHKSAYEDGSESWNLLSKDSMDIAYGIYLYHVDAPGIGEHIGKFAVIK